MLITWVLEALGESVNTFYVSEVYETLVSRQWSIGASVTSSVTWCSSYMLYVPVKSWLNNSGLCNSRILEKWWNKVLEARKCSLTLPLTTLVLSGSPMETSIYPDLPSTWVGHLGYSHKTRKAFGWLQTGLTSQLEFDWGGPPSQKHLVKALPHFKLRKVIRSGGLLRRCFGIICSAASLT